MREIKVRIHARMSRKKVRSGHLSPWIFLVFIDTLLILVLTYTVSLGKILFFGDFNAGKDGKKTINLSRQRIGNIFPFPKTFCDIDGISPLFSWPLLTRSRRKKDGIFTSDMYWAWGNLPAKKAKFYFPFLSPRCLSGSKAVLFCSFSPFLLRKKIFKRSRPPFMGCKGDRIEPKIMFGDKKRFSYKNRTSFREKKIMPAFFSLHPLHHARRFHTLLCRIEHHWALDAMIWQLIPPPFLLPMPHLLFAHGQENEEERRDFGLKKRDSTT